MKTLTREKKTNSAAIFALLICAALLLGCPGPNTEPGPGPGPNPPGPTDPTEYDISITPASQIHGTVTADLETAVEDTTVTITIVQASGWKLDEVKVLKPNGFPVDVSGTGTTRTFTMPASNARIEVSYITTAAAAERLSNTITTASSWADIKALNDLIKEAINTPTALHARALADNPDQENMVQNAIKKLAGTLDSSGNITTAANVGIIRQIIQKQTSWTSQTSALASFPHHLPETTTGPSLTAKERTILYFIKSKITTTDLPITAPAGWDIVSREVLTHSDYDTDPQGAFGIIQIELSYKVGAGAYEQVVSHQLWVVPVAQYHVVYEAGVTGTFLITDCKPETSSEPTKVKDAWENTIVHLSQTNTKTDWTGMVGSGLPSPTLYTKISNVTSGSSNLVFTIKGENEVLVVKYEWSNSAMTASGSINKVEEAYFIPTSQVYTVTVSNQPAP